MTANDELIRCTRAHELDLAGFALDPRAEEFALFRAHYPRCADCTREVGAFAALAAVLEAEQSGPPAHPSPGHLVAYAEQHADLDANARARVASHLAKCAACRTELGVLMRFDLASLRAAAAAELPAEPRAARGAVRWREWLLAPLRAPAFTLSAAVVVVVAVVLLRARDEGAPTQPTAFSPQIAQTPSPPRPGADERASALPAAPTQRPPASPPAPQDAARIVIAPPGSSPSPALDSASSPADAATPDGAPLDLALVPREPPRYEPPADAGPIVRIAAVGRTPDSRAPNPQALAPAQLGATTRESPTLYWLLPEPTPFAIAISIVREDASAPLLDAMLPGPHAAGIHAISLRERGVRLAPGVSHQWFVALVRDPARRSRDLVSGGAIRFTQPDAALAARLAEAHARAVHAYAETGFWYDAYDQLARWSAAQPENELLAKHRAALLEQVGVAAAASPPPEP